MGYRLGTSEELADRRKARLAERYGKPEPVYDFVPEPVASLHALEDATPQQPEKKKGGRPKGSKNKAK